MTRFNLISIVKPDLKQKVPNLAIINSLFIAKVDLPNFHVNRQHSPPFQIVTNFIAARDPLSNVIRNTTKIITNQSPVLNKHTNSMPPLSTNNVSTNDALFKQQSSFPLSHPHNNQTTTTILPLNTNSLRQLTFDCQSATKFPAQYLKSASNSLLLIRSSPQELHYTTCPQTIPVWL